MQHVVEVLSLLSDDIETDDAIPGENLKLRLKGIEEEEILPGFILCNAENLCHSGRTFDAQVSSQAVYLHQVHLWASSETICKQLQHSRFKELKFTLFTLYRKKNIILEVS